MLTKKLAVCAALMSVVSFSAAAADQGSGVVNFKGTVVDAPCSIAPESVDQTIDFGQISKSQLAAVNGMSVQMPVNIKLVNCDNSTLQTVAITFTGATASTAPTELLTSGPTNTAVVMNGYGSDVAWGTEVSGIDLSSADTTLQFNAWVKQKSGGVVAEGDFQAVTNFTLAYS
ncbi:fimbrial protein [Lelliottia sp. WAP21]|uniref:fimbrial protein n=1 Tax=Lelliottia sp. WAP21 TaxID=2877426 RepID=UPI001E4C27DE|nr:fimbrial protein [Lelliottia sp. WAP21]